MKTSVLGFIFISSTAIAMQPASHWDIPGQGDPEALSSRSPDGNYEVLLAAKENQAERDRRISREGKRALELATLIAQKTHTFLLKAFNQTDSVSLGNKKIEDMLQDDLNRNIKQGDPEDFNTRTIGYALIQAIAINRELNTESKKKIIQL